MPINASVQNLINLNRQLTATDVNNMFYYYYGRTATSAEKSYWSKKTSQQLSSALTPNADQFTNSGYYKDTANVSAQPQSPQVPSGDAPIPISISPAITGSGATSPTPSSTPPLDITKPVMAAAFKTTAAYQALPQGIKDFVDIAYNLIEVGGEDEAKLFSNAITQAQAVADPYYKTQLTLAKAEVLGSIAEKNADFETKREIIQRARDELLADVGSNKEFLSLEQQAEISRTVKTYDEDLLSIADQAAEKGITFATGARSRALAEERRSAQFSDVVQSSQRQYNFKIKELELKAARGDTDAQKQLSALSGQKTFAMQQIGRAAEEVLGTANLPAVEGYAPTGGVLGKIEEEKRKAITADTTGFMNLQRGFI
jgi:hypothetical protein